MIHDIISISDFDYDLPDEKIAKYPIQPRDSSKLLVSNAGRISHEKFEDIAEYLPNHSLLVFNDTKVIPARIHFKRQTGAIIEVFLLKPVSPSTEMNLAMAATQECVWECVIGNKKKWKPNEDLTSIIQLNNTELSLKASWENIDSNQVKLSWKTDLRFDQIIQEYGKIPLPPYLNRESDETDLENYQTVFSKQNGAVAAPTAGLHFSEKVLQRISKFKQSFVTLHVGAGTFMPVKSDNVLDHPMHNEQMVIDKDFILKILYHNGPVIPIGTTSMRTLESLYWFGYKLIKNPEADFFIEKLLPYNVDIEISTKQSFEAIKNYFEAKNTNQIIGKTEILIVPGYKFKVCTGLITNFHQPKSTLLLLVAALIGNQHWKEIYNQALKQNYRFLSFGDSSLLIP